MILKFIFLLNIGATQEPNAIIFEQEKSDLYIIEQEAEVTINFTYTIIEPKKPNKYCNIDQNRSLKVHFLNIITELLTGTVTGSSKTREKRQVLSIISAVAGFEFGRLFFSNDNHNSITQIESTFNNKLETLECQMYSKLGIHKTEKSNEIIRESITERQPEFGFYVRMNQDSENTFDEWASWLVRKYESFDMSNQRNETMFYMNHRQSNDEWPRPMRNAYERRRVTFDDDHHYSQRY